MRMPSGPLWHFLSAMMASPASQELEETETESQRKEFVQSESAEWQTLFLRESEGRRRCFSVRFLVAFTVAAFLFAVAGIATAQGGVHREAFLSNPSINAADLNVEAELPGLAPTAKDGNWPVAQDASSVWGDLKSEAWDTASGEDTGRLAEMRVQSQTVLTNPEDSTMEQAHSAVMEDDSLQFSGSSVRASTVGRVGQVGAESSGEQIGESIGAESPVLVGHATTTNSAAGTTIPAQCGFIEDGVEYPGNDLESPAPASDAEACCQRCTANSECTAWTWMKPDYNCYLKGGRPRSVVTRVFNVNCTSGMPTQVSRSIPRIQRSRGQSLFCFSLVLPWGNERSLLRLQYTKGASIFACDEYAAYSNMSFEVAPAVHTRIVNTNLACPLGGQFMTVLNTPVFMSLWAKVIGDGRFRFHDWTLKIDPDAVFFPTRLRCILPRHPEADGGTYLNNCKFGLHGPVEVFSRNAVQAFAVGREDCHQRFLQACSGPCLFGEDMYMDLCMQNVLKVRRDDEWRVLLEDHCDPPQGWASCENPTVAAFHPFKSLEGYSQCLQTVAERQVGDLVD